jgi:hypothetical protein
LFLDDVLAAVTDSGWELIDAKKAYEDGVYDLKVDVLPCGESLVWQSAKINPGTASALRYPAEDGDYEKQKLEDFLHTYNTNANKSSKPGIVTPKKNTKN